MQLKLKICGMREPDNIEEITALQPDYLGLIFYDKSPRFVKDLIAEIPSEIKKTGVFVDAFKEMILEKVIKFRLAAIQLHGNESPEFCQQLKEYLSDENLSVEVIKVFGVKDDFNFDNLDPYEGVADFYLFDTKGKNKGGNGISFNWNILRNYPSRTPFFLSGGIGQEEVSAIKELYKDFQELGKQELFYALDVNSKFEDAPGLKNVKKLQLFREKLFSK